MVKVMKKAKPKTMKSPTSKHTRSTKQTRTKRGTSTVKQKQKDWSKTWAKQLRRPYYMAAALAIVVGLAAGGYALHRIFAATCTVSSNLVNSCHPLLGAQSGGYPGVSGWKATILNHEKLIGRKLDIVHNYHRSDQAALNSDEKYFISRSNTTLFLNWKPDAKWKNADGRSASVNARIDSMANSLKSVAPHKVMFTVYHEPENDVSGGASGCNVKYVGSAGTPAEYRAMWANVRKRFDAKGVNNVVWVMNYMGFSNWDCLVPQLWPGNSRVDWVMWDPYSVKESFNSTVGRFYNYLKSNSNSSHNYASKPWGLAEWQTWQNTTQPFTYSYYDQAKAAVEKKTFPNLKAYVVFDYADVERIAYDSKGKYDATEVKHYKAFANSAAFKNPTGATTQPAPTTPPKDTQAPSKPGSLHATVVTDSTVSLAWNASTDNVGVTGYRVYRGGKLVATQAGRTFADQKLSASTSYTYSVQAYDAAGNVSGTTSVSVKTQAKPASKPASDTSKNTSNDAGETNTPIVISPADGGSGTVVKPGAHPVVGGNILLALPHSSADKTTVTVDGVKITSKGKLNTTFLKNGQHTVTITTKHADGTTNSATRTITIQNKLNPWQRTRNTMFASMRGNPTLMNTSFWGTVALVVLVVGFLVYHFVLRRLVHRFAVARASSHS